MIPLTEGHAVRIAVEIARAYRLERSDEPQGIRWWDPDWWWRGRDERDLDRDEVANTTSQRGPHHKHAHSRLMVILDHATLKQQGLLAFRSVQFELAHSPWNGNEVVFPEPLEPQHGGEEESEDSMGSVDPP